MQGQKKKTKKSKASHIGVHEKRKRKVRGHDPLVFKSNCLIRILATCPKSQLKQFKFNYLKTP